MSDIGTVTVGERPTRASVAVSGLVVAGIAGLVHGGWDTTVVVVAAAVWLALSVIGFAQLVRAIRRELA